MMRALLLVDLQNDFLPGGALPVSDGDLVIPVANRLQSEFPLVVATKDWHPAGHASFASSHPGRKPGDLIELDGLQQVLWPVHCVADSAGSEFAPGLETAKIDQVIYKGTHPRIDSYSGFFDNGHRQATGLDEYLKARDVDHLVVMGLATDYCVKFTVLDAIRCGFRVHFVEDGCRGVELSDGDVARAIEEMAASGAAVCHSESFC